MKILLCTFGDEAIASYTQYSFPRMFAYAAIHGYDFKIGTELKSNRHPSWGKIQMIRENLGLYDLILFLDADMWINDLNVKIEDINLNGKSIGICDNGLNGGRPEHSPSLNCGSLLVKNFGLNWNFFEAVNEYNGVKNWEHFWEQDVINELYHNHPIFHDLIEVLPMRTMNSWWMDNEQNASQNFIFHMMARTTEDKAEIFKRLSLSVMP